MRWQTKFVNAINTMREGINMCAFKKEDIITIEKTIKILQNEINDATN